MSKFGLVLMLCLSLSSAHDQCAADKLEMIKDYLSGFYTVDVCVKLSLSVTVRL